HNFRKRLGSGGEEMGPSQRVLSTGGVLLLAMVTTHAAIGAVRNYTGYCNKEVDALIDQQSIEANVEKRKQLVWQIERRLAEDGARPIIFYPRGGTCVQPYVKGLVTMVNSIYNGYRMEDVWLDR